MTRVLVIGFDSMDVELVDKWAATGDLPTFRKLRGEALSGSITNPFLLESGGCWPAFATGVDPDKSGQFDGARYFDPETYEIKHYLREDLPRPAFWEDLAKASKRCASIDVPTIYPARFVNGIEVVDRSTHVPAEGGYRMRFNTQPPELKEEILTQFGPDPGGLLPSGHFPVDTVSSVQSLMKIMRARVKDKTDLILHYFSKEDWDFFIGVFHDAHNVGHDVWHVHDLTHPRHRADILAAVGDPIKQTYIELDHALARILDSVDDDVLKIVYLSHGMGRNSTGAYFLDRILARIEGLPLSNRSRWEVRAGRAMWRRLPGRMRQALRPLRSTVYKNAYLPNRHKRKYFEIYCSDRVSGVRVNLKGREAQGVVEPGREYEEILSMLTRELSAVRKVPSGSPMILRVERTSDHYSGSALDRLPDLLVEWNRDEVIDEIESDKIGRINRRDLPTGRTGDHRTVARFFATGAGLQHKQLNEPVKCTDFAPTIASILGVELENVDGMPIAAMLESLSAVAAE